ncbi:hypothetical protein E0K83_00260 [Gramella sp. BOM4]|nr:hypothetical protein [Christiangramia bathymodioli]
MLSIIISTYRNNLYEALIKNINITIGNIEYEIIPVVNPGKMSISRAYNMGAETARFKKLLFLHEDIRFNSDNWGINLIKSLNTNNVGIIGLAGNKRKSNLPTGHDQGIPKDKYIFVTHQVNGMKKINRHKDLIRVKTLDGVFLALNRDVWKELKFNESLKGYHFYDLDISLRASKNYSNFVNPNISIQHFSRGQFNDQWIINCLEFHKADYNFDEIDAKEKNTVRKFWYKRLSKENISLKNRLKYVSVMRFNLNSYKSAFKFISTF